MYAVIFAAINYVVMFPLHFYRSFLVEHKYGLSNQTLPAWIKDELKGGVLSLPVFLAGVGIFYFLLIRTGQAWWLWLALVWLAFTLIFMRIMPTVIIPLFYKYSKVSDQTVADKIKDTARRAGILLLDVFVVDFSKKTKKANAAVVGIGRSRRVLLTDNLLAGFTLGEIDSVVAHEFAHHRLRHLAKLIAFSIISNAVGFYILNLCMGALVGFLHADRLTDIRIFPSFMTVLFLFGLFLMPIQNAYSRMLEKEADLAAVELTGDKESFATCMEKLAKSNLSDPNPPALIKYLFFSHPPISERIAYVRNASL